MKTGPFSGAEELQAQTSGVLHKATSSIRVLQFFGPIEGRHHVY